MVFTYDELLKDRLDSVERIVVTTWAPFSVGEGFLKLCLQRAEQRLDRGNGWTRHEVGNIVCKLRMAVNKCVDEVDQL